MSVNFGHMFFLVVTLQNGTTQSLSWEVWSEEEEKGEEIGLGRGRRECSAGSSREGEKGM